MAQSSLKSAFYFIFATTAAISIVLLSYQVYNSRTSKVAVKKLGLTFDVGPMELVAMTITDTKRYALNDKGGVDLASLMPSGGHTVHISTSPDDNTSLEADPPETYTVSLFHQLKCLEIYHREYLKPLPRHATAELRGCLNYLRQSLLCHANTRLESVKNVDVQASKQYETVCRDWTKVYEAAERNYEDYRAWDLARTGK